MRDSFSNASTAPLPSGLRPPWVRQTRSATAFWMPSVAVLAITIVLVLMWPHKPRHVAAHVQSMPEATASYVLLEESYSALPGNPLGNPWPGPGGSMLPEREEAPGMHRLPSPEYTSIGILSPWTPTRLASPAIAAPNLAARPVTEVLTGFAPVPAGPTMILSPGLQRSGFQFEMPPDVTTGMPTVARFHVELDDKGDVIHLLAEPADNPASARLLETAISRGHGTRAGSGQVVVSWGK